MGKETHQDKKHGFIEYYSVVTTGNKYSASQQNIKSGWASLLHLYKSTSLRSVCDHVYVLELTNSESQF